MDVATLVGVVSGIGLLIVAALTGGHASIFWSFPSIIIVLGGTLASTLIHYPLADVLNVWTSVKNAFVDRVTPPERLIQRLIGYAAVARKEGVLALEMQARHADDPFLRHSLQLAVDGTPPDLMRELLMAELASMEGRHTSAQSILVTMGTFAPAFGIIGTLIGLVKMFTTLNEPSRIGQGMAVAMLTTLYGALLANVVFLPAAGKLRARTHGELLCREIIVEGVLSIQSGDSPYVVAQKLKTFIAPAVREQISLGS